MRTQQMEYKASGCLPAPILFIVLAAGVIGLLRSGYLLSIWSVYQFLGSSVDAVVEQCEPYKVLKRKPRPSTYFYRYRGIYGFDVRTDKGTVPHMTGRFDTRNFTVSGREELKAGDRIPVVYLAFNPSRSRPAGELGWSSVVIALPIFLVSLFLTVMCSAFLYLRRRYFPNPPNPPFIKGGEEGFSVQSLG